MKNTCAWCGRDMGHDVRIDKETCSGSHRVMWNRWRSRMDDDVAASKAMLVRNVDDSLTVGQTKYLMRTVAELRAYYLDCLQHLARSGDRELVSYGKRLGVQLDFGDAVERSDQK